MADNRANLLYGESASLSALLSNIVNSRNIINVGIITKVIDENFINVRLYNTDIGSSPTYISAVRLLHIGTSKLKIKVTPAIGDTVLLLASRDFIEVLENNHDKKAADVLVEPYSKSIQNYMTKESPTSLTQNGIQCILSYKRWNGLLVFIFLTHLLKKLFIKL